MLKEKIIEIIDGGSKLEFRVRQLPATDAAELVMKAGAAFAPALGPAFKATGGGLAAILAAYEQGGFATLGQVDMDKAKAVADELLRKCCARVTRDEGGKVAGYQACSMDGSMDGYVTDFRTIFKLVADTVRVNYGFLAPGGEAA